MGTGEAQVTTADQSRDVFVGRQTELEMLQATLAHVRAGQPRVVLIEGPAGIGKTALVSRFLRVETDVHVLRASGEPWEALVPFGVVDQLIRVAGGRRASVLAGRERVLPVDEPISVGARLLELMGDLDGERPVVMVIDDAQWADLDSLRALLFALRRLVADRVMALLTVRPEDMARLPEGLRRLAEGPSGRTLRLGALDASQVRNLATSLGLSDFTARTAARLHAHTEGNPLYIRALLSEVAPDRWRDWQPALPAPRAFAALVVRRLESCSPAGRRLVEAAAVLGRHAALSSAAALGEVDEPLSAVEEAILLDLLRARDVIPVPVQLVEIYKVGKEEPTVRHLRVAGSPDPLLNPRDAIAIVGGVV